MAASRLARREPPKSANAALQSLEREQPFPADCALPWRIWAALKVQNKVRRGTGDPPDDRESRITGLANKVQRRLETRFGKKPPIYFGFGMFGLIGWSVAVPTVAGIALGIWIDNAWPSRYSWTLMLLVLGVVLGCLNAWHWIERESSGETDVQRRSRRR